MNRFSRQKIAVQTAQSGGSRRPRREDERAPAAVAPTYGGGGEAEGYSNFSRGREREGGRGSSYGDTWGGVKGGSKGQEGCYNCGEVSICALPYHMLNTTVFFSWCIMITVQF